MTQLTKYESYLINLNINKYQMSAGEKMDALLELPKDERTFCIKQNFDLDDLIDVLGEVEDWVDNYEECSPNSISIEELDDIRGYILFKLDCFKYL